MQDDCADQIKFVIMNHEQIFFLELIEHIRQGRWDAARAEIDVMSHVLFQLLTRKSHNLRTGPINEGQQYFVTLHQAMMQRQEIADQVQGTKDEEPPTRKVKL